MDKFFRNPIFEEGDNNIILQNRCGNRLTLMFKPSGTDLEFTYKPNASRRKDFAARNFSNRDNQTVLFPTFTMPDIYSTEAKYEYDPYLTRVKINAPSGAKNTLSVLNIDDENAFVLSARSPLLLAFKPHKKFELSDGLITEKFTERGEEIVSFIKFPGIVKNRFRILANGTYVLQVLENDVILIGGEENSYQVNRVCKKFEKMKLNDLISRNEEIIKYELSASEIFCKNKDFKNVLDINKRIQLSMIDEGGTTFGALSRCYYLAWTRDGSMSTSLMARGGYPQFVEDYTKLLLNNPSKVTNDKGIEIPEFGQCIGTRWSKSEDDGIFYAALCLYTTVQTTGKTDLLYGEEFKLLITAIDHYIEKAWEADKQMFGSDTRGETSLRSSPYYGYDVVNGEMHHSALHETNVNFSPIVRSYSLYNQVNAYNLLLMANVLLAINPSLDDYRSAKYADIAEKLKVCLRTKFINAKGNLYAGFEKFENGTEKFVPFGLDCDYWETAWANSFGPYFPLPEVQLKSAWEIRNDWTKYRNHGYCPWNTLSHYLYEYGMSSSNYEKMLTEQIKDALTLTKRYPMVGAVTEYQKEVEGWRALPFQVGALYQTMTAQLIKNMPLGIGVRASNFVDSINNYQFRNANLYATQTGEGDVVGTYKLNAKELIYTLQIPNDQLRNGANKLEVVRSKSNNQFRLYSSTAELFSYKIEGQKVLYSMSNAVETQLIFDKFELAKSVRIIDAKGKELSYKKNSINDKTMLECNTKGEFSVEVVF
ncbi:MAG: hypothetical protein EAZ07_03050 [Cytophagales bacterium]|nr:MAG: hypothetical protein EAZ07_03050 [Cytophagales bacterium]